MSNFPVFRKVVYEITARLHTYIANKHARIPNCRAIADGHLAIADGCSAITDGCSAIEPDDYVRMERQKILEYK